MSRRFAELQHIDCNSPITQDSGRDFLGLLQHTLLLTLLELGRLSASQYRQAENALRKQLHLTEESP